MTHSDTLDRFLREAFAGGSTTDVCLDLLCWLPCDADITWVGEAAVHAMLEARGYRRTRRGWVGP